MPRTKIQFLLAIVILLVIAVQADYLWTTRTSVPHQDEWSSLDAMFHALDEGRVVQWLFFSRNGHFGLPAMLGYLFSYSFLRLDLAPLRFLNFPICLTAFLLTVRVIDRSVASRALRYYLYLGAAFVVFNLCFWEFFTQGGAFSSLISLLFGGVALYYLARSMQPRSSRARDAAVGLLFLGAAVLSFGSGYAAVAAAIALVATVGLRRLVMSRAWPAAETITLAGLCVVGALAVFSHPSFELKGRLFSLAYHTIIVAGSIMSAAFETPSAALNAAYFFGLLLVAAFLWVIFDFVTRRRESAPPLLIFSTGLVLFGLLGCLAVSAARGILPDGEFLSSRYTIYPSMCLLGLMLYSVRSSAFMLPHVWCLIAAGYLCATVKERVVAPHRPGVYHKIAEAIRNVEGHSDADLRSILYWHENTEGVRRVAARMRRDRLNLFGESAAHYPAINE